ncbi:MAG TPA: class II aldolase/adducin family protein [Candidatus Hydrogenedentes bacterium]|nr:class II aldolase/adducin family protein [Candidatus Hydrogenedentota bacterium]
MSEVLQQLVEMSHYLGDPGRTYAILGEGNTSARIDQDSFYVKASGTTLATMKPSDFLAVSISKVTAILDDAKAGDADVDRVLKEALLDSKETRKPSVETMMHGLLYQLSPEYNFIGHTHPVATNALLCSVNAYEAVSGRVCPDHIVVMGHQSVFVPYVDPGLVLAREVRARVNRFIEEEGVLPKAIMLENHGLFALGSNAKKVTNITDMAEKVSNIIIGSYSVGGPKFMSPEAVRRIDTRPDELYRQKVIK